jgi:hypothetical protein
MSIQEIAELCETLHLETTIPMTILDIQKVTQDYGFPLEGPGEGVDLETGAVGQDRLDREQKAQDQVAAPVVDLQGLMEVTEVLSRMGREVGQELGPVTQVGREVGEELDPVTQVDLEGTNHHRRQLPRHLNLLA